MYNQRPFAEYPFVRLIIPLIAGIIGGFLFSVEWQFHLVIFLSCFLSFLFLSYFLQAGFQYRFRALVSLFLIISIFMMGYSLTQLNNQKHWQNHYSNYEDVEYLKIRLSEPLQKKKKSFKALGKIEEVYSEDSSIGTMGDVLLYFDETAQLQSLYCGDVILVNAKPTPIQSAKNPNEFDYSRYMGIQNIHAQIYLRNFQWVLIKKDNGLSLNTQIFRFRDFLVSVLKQNLGTGKETGVAAALLFGYKEELDPEIVSAFMATGTLHILAVSGMHVMIIYAALNLLLEILLKNKKGKYLRAIIIAGVVWFYALLCGLSPSILRAAVMLTFILAGSLVVRYPNVFNSLAASAFFLLLYNPYYLFDAGFLLSYFAVTGLIIFQPMIYSWIIFDNKLVDWIWNLTSVSLAAQLATFPISIFLFHQFPVYFLLSNLLLIPVTNFVIFGGAILLIVSPLPFLANTLGYLLNWLLWLTESVLLKIENLPGSLMTALMPNLAETILVYILILFATLYLVSIRKRYLFLSLSVCLMLSASFAYKTIRSNEQKEIIVYHVKGNSVIQLIDGQSAILLTDTSSLKKNIFASKMIKENSWRKQIKNTSLIDIKNPNNNKFKLYKHFEYYQFYDISLVRIKNKFELPKIVKRIQVDYLIISNNARIDLEDLFNQFDCKKVIFDSSNNYFQVKKYIAASEKLGINYYDVLTCGAFVEVISP